MQLDEMQFRARHQDVGLCRSVGFMMLAAVHPDPVFRRPALRPFLLGKDVFGSCRLCSAVDQIVVAVARRSVRQSEWGHFVSCLDRQSLKLSIVKVEAHVVCLQCATP